MPAELIFAGLPQDLAPEELTGSPIRQKLEEYKRAFADAGMTPSAGASPYAWDCAAIVLSGFRKLGTNATAAQMRDYILSLRGFVGMNGTYDFSSGDQHGLSGTSLVVIRWDPATNGFRGVSKLGGAPLR
jgi:hypothetical protein